MGLDTVVDSQDEQVIDQDAQTDEWGLCEDISQSKRGRIPEDRTTLIQRVEDERVRRALARGQSRDDVADTFDMTPRTTWYKQRRAQAYAFPLDAFTQHGRPPASTNDSVDTGDSGTDNAMAELSEDAEPDEVWPSNTENADEITTKTEDECDGSNECVTRSNGEASDGEDSVQAKLQQAIAALESVKKAL